MLQDYPLIRISKFNLTSFGSARPFWTLAIEWWIYLLFGYLILVVLRKNKITITNLLLLSFFSIVPLFNLILGGGNGLTTYWIFGLIVYLISTLNILKNISKKFKMIFLMIFAGLALFRAYFKMDAFDPIFAFLLAISFWLIIDIYKNVKISNNSSKIIRYNASISYTLYLIHYSILSFIQTHFGDSTNPYFLLIMGIFISNFISILIGRYTELSLTRKIKKTLYQIIENKSFPLLKKRH